MNRVFVFEETHLNISELWDFGDVTYVFTDGENRRSIRDHKLEEQIISQLTRFNFNPEKDYIAVTGKVLPIVIFLTALVSLYGEVKTLSYDAVEQGYFERTMGHLSQKEMIEVA